MRNETLKNLLLTASLISTSAFLTACGDTATTDSKPAQGAPGSLQKETNDANTAMHAAIAAADAGAAAPAINPDTASSPVAKTILTDTKAAADAMWGKINPALRILNAKNQAQFDYLKYFRDWKLTSSLTHANATANFDRILASQDEMLKEISRQKDLATDAVAFFDGKLVDLQTNDPSNITDSNVIRRSLAKASDMESALLTLARQIGEKKTALDTFNKNLKAVVIDKKAQLVTRDVMSEFINQMNLTTEDTIFDLPIGNRAILVGALVKYMEGNLSTFRQSQLPKVVSDLYGIVKPVLKLSLEEQDLLKRIDLPAVTYAEYLNVVGANSDRFSFTKDELETDIKERIKTAISNFEPVAFFFKDADELDSVGNHPNLRKFISNPTLALKAISDVSSNVSLRKARTGTGSVDLGAFKMNGVSGQSIDLGLPLFVQLKGDVSSAKSTEAATGSVAYRLGNTVIGAIQGYANSGAGFGTDSRQLETSVVASHSFGSFFVEGQIGSVAATDVHLTDWSGLRSQITLGLDTEFVSPFVQLTHRQLDRSGLFNLNETTGYVGLDMDIAKLAADTYSIDTRLLAKAGYGSKNWSAGSQDLGSTSGFSGSVEWSASLTLNSGISFSTNLALDTLAGSSAALNVSLDR